MLPLLLLMAPDITARVGLAEGYNVGTTLAATGTPVNQQGVTTSGALGLDIISQNANSSDMFGATGNFAYSDEWPAVSGTGGGTYAVAGAYRRRMPLTSRLALSFQVNGGLQRTDPAAPLQSGTTAAVANVGLTSGWNMGAGASLFYDLSPTWTFTASGNLVATGIFAAVTTAGANLNPTGASTEGGGVSFVLAKDLSSVSRLLLNATVTGIDNVKVIDALVTPARFYPTFWQQTDTLSAGYFRELSYAWTTTTTAGVTFATPGAPTGSSTFTPLINETVRYTGETFWLTGTLGYQYAPPTGLTPGGHQALFGLRASGPLGTRPPLRDMALSAGATVTRTDYTGGATDSALADVSFRLGLSPALGLIVSGAATFADVEGGPTASEVKGVAAYIGIGGMFSTLPLADPLTSVMSVPLGR